MWRVIVSLILAASSLEVTPEDGFLRDEWNRTVILHGVNAVYKTVPYLPNRETFDPEMSLSSKDIDYMTEWGFNVVRLGVIWQAVETSMGQYNKTYLELVKTLIDDLGKAGIYTLVDSHQDLFSNRLCGEGMPTFYTPQLYHSCDSHWLGLVFKLFGLCKSMEEYGFHYDAEGNPLVEDCKKNLFYFYYMSPEVNSLFYNFYTNSTLQEAFANYWASVVSVLGNNPYVLGYDLLNEPWPGNFFYHAELLVPQVVDRKFLQPMYERLHNTIRKTDQQSIIAFEATQFPDTFSKVAFPVGFTRTPGGPAYHNREQLNAHTYCCEVSATMCETGEPTLENAKTVCKDFHQRKVDRRWKDSRNLGVGLIFSEFGACSASEACVEEIKGSVEAFDSHMVSWAYWQYKGFNDITTTGSASEGLFNPDGTVQEGKLKTLSRTYFRKIQGTPNSMQFDSVTGYFSGVFTADGSIPKPTEVYLNKALHYPNGAKVLVTNYWNGPESKFESDNILLITHSAGDHGDTYVVISPQRHSTETGSVSQGGVTIDYSISESSPADRVHITLDSDNDDLHTEIVAGGRRCPIGEQDCVFFSYQMYKATLKVSRKSGLFFKTVCEWELPPLNGETLSVTLKTT